MSYPAALQGILDDLALFPERSERIEALIALGEEFRNPGPAEVPRTAENRVPGCESEAYVALGPDRSLLIAVDNPQGISAMALAVILQQGLGGATPQQAATVQEDIVEQIFGRELSMGKTMGLTGMVRLARLRLS